MMPWQAMALSLCKKSAVVQNISNLLLKLFSNCHKHYNYLQLLQINKNGKLFTNDNFKFQASASLVGRRENLRANKNQINVP
jgi:hypothetical protein